MTARILPADQLGPAITELQSGGIVGIPTETVYGLAGDARDAVAVTKIFAAKERPHFDPLIVHIPARWCSVAALMKHEIVDESKVTDGMRELAEALMKAFWPGPLTILLPRHKKIPDLVTSGLELVGVRMPSHPVAQAILNQVKIPLAAPSANRFGRISPTTAQHVMSELGDRLNFIVDGGVCSVGVESTVVAVHDSRVSILRPGKVGTRDIQETIMPLGGSVDRMTTVLDEKLLEASPGTLASHYAPSKPLYILATGSKTELQRIPLALHARTVGILAVSKNNDRFITEIKKSGLTISDVQFLSQTGDPVEAAQRLFAAMRELDDSDAGVILCEEISHDDGLWYAIKDRLTRASQR